MMYKFRVPINYVEQHDHDHVLFILLYLLIQYSKGIVIISYRIIIYLHVTFHVFNGVLAKEDIQDYHMKVG